MSERHDRHQRDCRVCHHAQREEIEREFCEWKPLAAISRAWKISRPALYRHIRACGLLDRRDRNVKLALANFIERGYRVRVTAAAFVQAIAVYAKINADGELVDRTQDVTASRNQELFARMTRGEMLRYAESGQVPDWWPSAVTH